MLVSRLFGLCSSTKYNYIIIMTIRLVWYGKLKGLVLSEFNCTNVRHQLFSQESSAAM